MSNSDLLNNMNEQQAAAISAQPGPTLVVAGPGSGKTAVLTRRVAYLIKEFGVSPYNIMAVTFTNKAATEMTERINRLLSGNVKGLTVGTFHSICARILRREAEHLGIKSSYVIYDTGDQLDMVKQAIQDLKMDVEKNSPRRYLSKISNAKNELIEPDRYPADLYQEKLVRDVYRRYQQMLRTANAMDFDDLLMQAVILFRDHPDVLERYRYYYQHLLVDEFQDTNTAQYKLVTLLAGMEPDDPRYLFCVGDPDQSIYRFRGADYRNISNFRRDYPDAQIILLEHNYRSHQLILDAAMAVIDKNPDRIRKNLTSSRTDGQKIILRQSNSQEEEAMYIVQSIVEMKLRGRYEFRDCAVMFRTNAQSRSLEEAFVRGKVPYRLIGGTRFYDRKEVKDVLAYLRVIQNPDDTLNLERIINVPRRGIGEQSIAKLRIWANERHQSLFDALQAIPLGEQSPFSGKINKALADFARMLAKWRQQRDVQPVVMLLEQVIEETKYNQYLRDEYGPDADERIENVAELKAAAFNAGEKKLGEFLEDVALVADVDAYDQNQNAVILMTLHAAKGLEFPVVFMVGLEETVLPHQMSLNDPEQMEEERRLMYVGVTRAKDVLYLTWALTRAMYGRGDRMLPSRFLEDIPANLTTGSHLPRKAQSRLNLNSDDPLGPDWQTKWTPPKPPALNTERSSASSSVPSRPSINTTSLYKAGQKVLHAKFGQGVIVSSRIRSGEEELYIKFIGYGPKTLIASATDLVLIED
ncbi:MAG: UvrD-helicase domain-containing protein [Anaerolineae bacterium]|nr:UvrD-helicase domain-containing protein [Anaerolineae bacterium]